MYTFTPEDVQRAGDLPDLTELTDEEKVCGKQLFPLAAWCLVCCPSPDSYLLAIAPLTAACGLDFQVCSVSAVSPAAACLASVTRQACLLLFAVTLSPAVTHASVSADLAT